MLSLKVFRAHKCNGLIDQVAEAVQVAPQDATGCAT